MGQPAPAVAQPGELLLGRYEVEAALPGGAYSEVLRVRDTRSGQLYAAKTPSDGASAEFLDHEVSFWLQLPPHPNIVTAYAMEIDVSRPYLFLEYVPGGTLRVLIGQPANTMSTLTTMRAIAEGMATANSRGQVAHLDLKPENILLSSHGVPKVTDFGTLRQVGENVEPGPYPTVAADTGTYWYRAPEVVLGKRRVDQKSDIFSFGLIAYELSYGQLPFPEGADLAEYYSSEAPHKLTEELYYYDDPVTKQQDPVRVLLKRLASVLPRGTPGILPADSRGARWQRCRLVARAGRPAEVVARYATRWGGRTARRQRAKAHLYSRLFACPHWRHRRGARLLQRGPVEGISRPRNRPPGHGCRR